MRISCPVCYHEAIDQFETNYAIPDGWTLPSYYIWKLCKCGFIWAHTDKTAEDFDQYYRDHFDPAIDIHDIDRLHNLASFIFKNLANPVHIVDFGGGDEMLSDILDKYGFDNVTTVNVDDKMPDCDVVVMSQIIEHLYDLRGVMDNINSHLSPDGIVIIETPDAVAYSSRSTPPLLDYYPTHVNHFSRDTLIAFMVLQGFMLISSSFYEYKATNARMMRMMFVKEAQKRIFNNVKKQIGSVEEIIIGEPVIVYGLGDLALYQIANSNLDIAYFVDENPIYKYATINGIPVKSKLGKDNYPVLVIGNRSRQAILDKLKDRRVIEV